jgi:hypothetical protein
MIVRPGMKRVLTASELLGRQLANTVIAGVLTFLVGLVALEFVSGQDLLVALSTYATGPGAWLYRTMFFGLAVAALGAGTEFLRLRPQTPQKAILPMTDVRRSGGEYWTRNARLLTLTPMVLLVVFCLLVAVDRVGRSSNTLLLSLPFLIPISIWFSRSFVFHGSRNSGLMGAYLVLTVLCVGASAELILELYSGFGLAKLPRPWNQSAGVAERAYFALVVTWLMVVAVRLHQMERERLRAKHGVRATWYTARERSLALLLVSHCLEFLTDLTPYENFVYGIRELLRKPTAGQPNNWSVWLSDIYVGLNLAILVAVWALITSAPLLYFAAAFALWRLVDILATNFRILLVDADRPGWGVVSASRSVLLGLINVVQIAVIFAIVDHALAPTGFLDPYRPAQPGAASPAGFLYLSWTTLITLGSGYEPISPMAKALIMLELASSFLMFVVILAAFVSLLTARAVGPSEEVVLDHARASLDRLVKSGKILTPSGKREALVESATNEAFGLLQLLKIRPEWLTSVHPLGITLTEHDVTEMKGEGALTDDVWDHLMEAADQNIASGPTD